MEQTNKTKMKLIFKALEKERLFTKRFYEIRGFYWHYMGVESTALGQVAKSLATSQDCLLFGSIFKNAPAVVNLLFGQTILCGGYYFR